MRLIFYSLILMSLASCTGYQYVAAPAYVPLNTEKKHLKANLDFNHAQIGYSVTNHVSLFATGLVRDRNNFPLSAWGSKEGSKQEHRRDHSKEYTFGGSYFTTTENVIFEVHAGAGFGDIYYRHEIDEDNSTYLLEMNGKKNVYFIQPSLGFRFKDNDHIQLGLFSRFTLNQYYNLNTTANLTRANNEPPDKEDLYFANRTSRDLYFAEPGVCFRVGGKLVMFDTQLSKAISFQSDNVRYRRTNLYLTLFLNFDLFRKD